MNILQKIQQQSYRTRKIILWIVIVILGISLLVWWSIIAQQRLKDIGQREIETGLPLLQEKISGISSQESSLEKDLDELGKQLETGLEELTDQESTSSTATLEQATSSQEGNQEEQ